MVATAPGSDLLYELVRLVDQDDQRKVDEALETLKQRSMLDMCRELRGGRVSKRFIALQEHRVRRRQERREQEQALQEQRESMTPLSQASDVKRNILDEMADAQNIPRESPNVSSGIQVTYDEHGKVQVVKESMTVDRHLRDQVPRTAVVHETDYDRRVNSATFSKRERTDRWTASENERFYQCLEQWGTDFEIMSKLFRNRTRAQLKRKFNKEDRVNPARVRQALSGGTRMSQAEYEHLAGLDGQ